MLQRDEINVTKIPLIPQLLHQATPLGDYFTIFFDQISRRPQGINAMPLTNVMFHSFKVRYPPPGDTVIH